MARCLNCIHCDVCDIDRHEKEHLYGDCSDFLNGTDVVPKSEVVLASSDAVKMLIECHGYALTHDADIKKEVAREIFEEIDEELGGLMNTYHKSQRFSDADVIRYARCLIAELKKKYTEEKE